MRRAIVWLGRIYPRAWRVRYGDEFDALLEEADADWRQLLNVFGGAMKMQIHSGNAWKWIAGLAAACAVLATAAPLANPSYVSTAVVRCSTERLFVAQDKVLSRTSLAGLILSLDLYREERARQPLEQIVYRMRTHDLRLDRAGDSTLRLTFAYRDRAKAQAVVRELTTRFAQQNARVDAVRASNWSEVWAQPAPPEERGNWQVLTPASAAAAPPSRFLAYAACGLAAGLFLGLAAMLCRRWPDAARQLAAWAALGGLLAGGWSYAIHPRFTSTADVRLIAPVNPDRWYATAPRISLAEHVDRMQREILADDNLEAIILDPQLDLYSAEIGQKSLRQVVAEMRDRDLRIRLVDDPLAPRGESARFIIAFSYPDPDKAQAVVRRLMANFSMRTVREMAIIARVSGGDFQQMAERNMGERIEVGTPPDLPETPVWPNRPALAGAGAAAGMVLAAWRRRR